MHNTNKIVILGAAGNFGRKIAELLLEKNISLVLAGRHAAALKKLHNMLAQKNPNASLEISCFDVTKDLIHELQALKPLVVINTCGPFQAADYSIPLNCIKQNVNYIDLADGRAYVTGFASALDQIAKQHHCLAITGASTVPCLSAAVLDFYQSKFSSFELVKYGISPGQKTTRGLATVASILSYVGKPFRSSSADCKKIYGWQDLYRQPYPVIGKRWMANCDIPDLDLLPKLYDIKNLQFAAGLESTVLHLTLWVLSWCVRMKLPINLEKHAKLFLKLSHWFDRYGTADGGMHMLITGKDHAGEKKSITWFLIAKNNSGPYVPAAPAAVLANKIINQKLQFSGAYACVKLINLEEYLAELGKFDIETFEQVGQ